MKRIGSVVIFLFSFFSYSQTNCDSLVINCCDVTILNNDTISLYVHNDAQMEIFSYPGFKLKDGSSNVVAMETVNYFGIGTFDQIHNLNIVQAFPLPFTGTLELWGGFYDTLYCVFPITITTNSIQELENKIAVYPNPVIDFVTIEGFKGDEISIYSMDGKIIMSLKVHDEKVNLSTLKTGCYLINSINDETLHFMIYKN